MTALERWGRARRLLCVRLDSLGDVLMTTPALRALKESQPARHLTLLTSSSGAAVAPLIPEIDEVIVYDAPWLKATATRENSQSELMMAKLLAGRAFDAAVIFTVYSQSPLPAAFLCHLANIASRAAHCHENPYQLLSDWIPDPEPARLVRHEVQRHLDLVAVLGASAADQRLSLRVPETAARRVDELLSDVRARTEPWVIVHPGATAASRRYPPESFAAAADRLAREHGWQIVFTGSANEIDLVEHVRSQMKANSISFAGRLSLAETAALVSRARLLIANNTGVVHVAAALGTPVVDLYALTNPQHTPWQVPCRVLSHDVPCRNCYRSVCPEGHHHCLKLIAPNEIAVAAVDLLNEVYGGFKRAAPEVSAVGPARREKRAADMLAR